MNDLQISHANVKYKGITGLRAGETGIFAIGHKEGTTQKDMDMFYKLCEEAGFDIPIEVTIK